MGKRRSAKKKNSTNGSEVVEKPRLVDVLFGRGGHVNHHPGNQEYLKLVTSRKEEYYNCQKAKKAKIAWDIIRQLREREPHMKFLRKDYNTNRWHVVEDADVRRKISQCLREKQNAVCPTAKNKAKQQQQQQQELAAAAAPGKQTKKKLMKKASSSSTKNNRGKTSSSYTIESDEDEWLPKEEEVTYPVRVVTRSSSSRHESDEEYQEEAQESPENPYAHDDDYDLEKTAVQTAQAQEDYDATAAADAASTSGSVDSSLEELQSPSASMAEEAVQPLPVPSTSTSASSSSNNQVIVPPPPMPARVPLKQPEGSNRVWSDFFTRSFTSFAPSIFDLSSSGNPESAWENLLDPSILPELATSEDEESFAATPHPIMPTSSSIYSSQESSTTTTTTTRTYSQVSISNPIGWGECISSPATKRRKTSHVPLVDDKDVETDPLSLYV